MVQKLFIWKMAAAVSVFFLLVLIPQDARATGSCIFDPALEETVKAHCQNTQISEARSLAIIKAKAAGYCSSDDECFLFFDNCEQDIANGVPYKNGIEAFCKKIGKDPGFKLIYNNCFAGGCTSIDTDRRYFCGWERMSEKMCNEENEECMKNWSSCYFQQQGDDPLIGQCQIASKNAKKLCESFLGGDKCENGQSIGYNKKKHGCKWEETVQNGCYCVSNESMAAGKTNDYLKETLYTKGATNKDSNVCVDLPFSKSSTFSKCAWFEDDKKTAEGVRTDINPGTGNNGCWCQKFGSNTLLDYNLLTYSILDQKACDSWIFGSGDQAGQNLQYCYWKENGKVVSITEKKSNTGFNGCYCSKGKTADVNNLKQGWTKGTAQEGLQKDTCLNIQKIVDGSWPQCAWVENDVVKGYATANGKEGCYCNTVKDAEIKFVPTLTQSKQKCLDAPAQEHRPLCEWWDKNKLLESKENKDALKDSEKYLPVPYAPIPFTIPSTASLNKIGTTDPKIFIGRLITTLMGILGSIALVMFIYGGILYMTDAGSEERVTKAKHIVVWTALGLAMIFASYAILKIVFDAVK